MAGVLVSFWYPERTHGMSTTFNPKFDQNADLQVRPSPCLSPSVPPSSLSPAVLS